MIVDRELHILLVAVLPIVAVLFFVIFNGLVRYRERKRIRRGFCRHFHQRMYMSSHHYHRSNKPNPSTGTATKPDKQRRRAA